MSTTQRENDPDVREDIDAGGVAGPGRVKTDLSGTASSRVGDKLFARVTTTSGILLLVLLLLIVFFLINEARGALSDNTANFFSTKIWDPDGSPSRFGIAALAFGTALSSLLAMLLAVPVAIGAALFITQYAPRRLAQGLGYLVDLLAAVPSVVYGLWGLFYLIPTVIKPTSEFLEDHLGFLPFFKTEGFYGKSIFAAAVVLAIMILPIVSAIAREVFLQVPVDHKEAALALGATRWEMIRTAVLPFGRPGVISAGMLGLGRALGETIAVALVLSSNFEISFRVLQPGGNTIAANIANQFGFAGGTGRGALIASGLALFVITLIVNMGARAIVARRKEFSGAAS